MKDKDLTDILAECLDSIAQGERTVEECLAHYPNHRDELSALLGTVSTVRRHADYTLRPNFRLSSRTRLLRRLPPLQTQKSPPIFRRWVQVWATVLVLIISTLGAGTVYASSDTLPGDTLYSVKLTIEDARLLFADDTEDVALASEFALKRLEEIQSLIELNRAADLDLAVTLFSNQVLAASDSLEAVAQTDPERAAELGLELEQALSRHTERLNQLLEHVPVTAKPAIENAIRASNRGKDIVQQLIEDGHPGGGQPENLPGPANDSPGGGPPNDADGDGRPDHAGPPNDADGDGKPDHAGTPGGKGSPKNRP